MQIASTPLPSLTAGTPLPAIRIATVNTSSGAKGSIHDDDTARQMGYAGGFVPGVTVMGYMARLMNEVFGTAWLRTGRFDSRLRLPTYAGIDVTVEGTVVEEPSSANGGRVTVELRVLDPDGRTTSFATASCVAGTEQQAGTSHDGGSGPAAAGNLRQSQGRTDRA